jgi:protein-histidine pros-kinase
MSDVAEWKKAEEKFKGLLQAAPDAMVIVNQEGEIVLVNSQTERMFGYVRSELIRKNVAAPEIPRKAPRPPAWILQQS